MNKIEFNNEIIPFRDKFCIPKNKNGKELIYFCGNSLGLKPKATDSYILQELNDWANLGVEGHFEAQKPWVDYHKTFSKSLANLIGAEENEVVAMNSLSVNLHLLMVSFYNPQPTKYKILIEQNAFPSDQYIVASQAKFHGYNPNDAIIEIKPENGKICITTDVIISTIEQHKNELNLILLGAVNYYTGQAFELKKITEVAQKYDIKVGLDLAHAIGNISLDFKQYPIDFATWCSYKYLNSGPGGVSGVYINKKYFDNNEIKRFEGWWGHDEKERFLMGNVFKPMHGAAAWQLSNAPILSMASHAASLAIFDLIGMEKLVNQSKKLHLQLRNGLEEIILKYNLKIEIITPKDENQHGCQLSILINENGKELFQYLKMNDIVVDWRNPNVIRMAPVPLYNTFEEIAEFLIIFEQFYSKSNF